MLDYEHTWGRGYSALLWQEAGCYDDDSTRRDVAYQLCELAEIHGNSFVTTPPELLRTENDLGLISKFRHHQSDWGKAKELADKPSARIYIAGWEMTAASAVATTLEAQETFGDSFKGVVCARLRVPKALCSNGSLTDTDWLHMLGSFKQRYVPIRTCITEQV